MKRLTGYLALLDVLGFSALISRETHAEELMSYIECVQEATQGKGDAKAVQYVLFSDSIVLNTSDDDEESLKGLLRSCSHLFRLLLATGFPVRGAVSHGSFFRAESPSGVFVAGRPIIEAHHFEQAQNWIGIMLAPSVRRKNPSLEKQCCVSRKGADEDDSSFIRRLDWMLYLQPWGGIPFHTDSPFDPDSLESLAVVPTEGHGASKDNMIQTIAAAREDLARLKSLAPDPKSQRKYVVTDQWLQYVYAKWSDMR